MDPFFSWLDVSSSGTQLDLQSTELSLINQSLRSQVGLLKYSTLTLIEDKLPWNFPLCGWLHKSPRTQYVQYIVGLLVSLS